MTLADVATCRATLLPFTRQDPAEYCFMNWGGPSPPFPALQILQIFS